MTDINIKILNDLCKIPTRGSEYAAGYDLYAAIEEPIVIEPHKTEKVGTGFALELPEGKFGAIVARSGLATKQGLRPANCIGICDSDYRGEYIVALHNDSDEAKTIHPYDRIAQLIIMDFNPISFNIVNELEDTERGTGGFGSTGEN